MAKLPPKASLVAGLQGAYFAFTGIWPLISIRSFQAVTGRKTDHLVTGLEGDHWLVNAVGVLVLSIGLTLLVSAWRRTVTAETAVLGVSSALALAAIDVFYVSRRTIAPIYLGDAVIELAIVAAWLLIVLRRVG